MLTHPTLEQMHALGLKGMAAAYHDMAEQGQAEELNRDDWLALMLDREAATRADKRLANRLRAAKLRFSEACIEDIDFATERGLDRRNIPALAAGASVFITGGGSGIGAALTEGFLQQGAKVAFVQRYRNAGLSP